MMKKVRLFVVLALCAALFAAAPLCSLQAQAAENTAQSVQKQMPGFVLEQWSAPRLMMVSKGADVTEFPYWDSVKMGRVEKGQYVNSWGQTDTGWYFIEYNGALGYVRYEAAYFVSQEEQAALAAQQQAALAAQQQAALAAQQQAALEAQQQAALAAQQQAALAAQQQAASQPAVAGVVFIGDSRMVTLKEAVERNLGPCPAAVVAKNGSRYEWLHDTGIGQADKIIGNGSKVVINMGVNDLSDADKYAQLVNAWAALWTQRGATVYYASVNPVWANDYGITEERVELFNARLQPQLIPEIIWLDSHTYLMQHGVHAKDGLHYKDDTNLVLFNYYMTMIGAI